MNISGKVWGKTQQLIKKSAFEVHRLEIDAGGFCSKHKHNYKNNTFYVERGCIEVKVWKKDYDLIDSTFLMDGESTNVKCGEYHQFIAKEDSIVYEIYWLNDISEDIERESIGGIR